MTFDLAQGRLRIPHAVVLGAIRRATHDDPELSGLALAIDDEGYVARMASGDNTLTVLIRPQRLQYANGTLTLQVETPRGARVEDRPIANGVVAGLLVLFGGTPWGQRVLSPGDVEGLVWDGLQATWTRPLGGIMASSSLVGRHARLTLLLEHDPHGLWVRSETRQDTPRLLTLLLKRLRRVSDT